MITINIKPGNKLALYLFFKNRKYVSITKLPLCDGTQDQIIIATDNKINYVMFNITRRLLHLYKAYPNTEDWTIDEIKALKVPGFNFDWMSHISHHLLTDLDEVSDPFELSNNIKAVFSSL